MTMTAWAVRLSARRSNERSITKPEISTMNSHLYYGRLARPQTYDPFISRAQEQRECSNLGLSEVKNPRHLGSRIQIPVSKRHGSMTDETTIGYSHTEPQRVLVQIERPASAQYSSLSRRLYSLPVG